MSVDMIARGMAVANASTTENIANQILTVGSFTPVVQIFTATAGQTVFELTGGATYDITKPAFAWVGGAIQTSTGVAGDNFARTSTSSFTMSAGVSVGTVVVFSGYKITDYAGNTNIPVTGNKTLALTDAMTYQNVTAAANITVPPNDTVGFSIGQEVVFFRDTDAEVAFVAGVGVTIKSDTSYLKIGKQNTSVYLKKVAINTWHLSGYLKA